MKNSFKDSPWNAGWKTTSQKKFVTFQEKKKPQISKPVKYILTILIRNFQLGEPTYLIQYRD